MRDLLQRFSPIQVFMIFLAIGLGFFGALLIPKAYAVSGGQRLIMIHDQDSDRGLITRATTLREVFQQSHITLDAHDRVEPGLDEKLVSDHYQVNIYRAHPVIISDGSVKQLVMTAYQTPKQVAKEAGISLRDEDRADLDFTNNFVSDGASVRMTIDRATPVQLSLYGKQDTVYTQATTVGGFLKEKNIKLGEKDQASLADDAPITAGMSLAIWRNGKQTITQEEAIPFETQTIQDANRDPSYKQINTPGVDGKKMVTYEIIMQDGKEVSRTVIQSVTTQQPTKQVQTVGVKEPPLPAGSHTDWMATAGMDPGNYGYIDYIFVHESGWNPAAASPNGYYGLGQTSLSNIGSACPNWRTDPICQIRWFNGYAVSRYGSWAGAYSFKKSHGWW
jgi:uncharacterized protein YabE (DUF348 family)